jgi:hypothetical protein
MKILMLLLIVLTVNVGCVSVPETRDPPDWSGVGNLEKKPAADAKNLPELCPIEVVEGRGTWSLECWQAFERFEIIATGNTKIARANTSALRSTEGANDALIEAGKLQQQLSDFYLDLLKDERQGRQLDVLTYRVIIALGLLGVAL